LISTLISSAVPDASNANASGASSRVPLLVTTRSTGRSPAAICAAIRSKSYTQ